MYETTDINLKINLDNYY